MKRIKIAVIAFLAVVLSSVCASSLFAAFANEENNESRLVYNAAEDFSDLGSDFWNYYFIDADDFGEFTPLAVNGQGMFGEYYPDGSFGYEYKYVVGTSDFTSTEHYQYLEIWGGVYMHPGLKADTVLSFVAPVDGVVNINATVNAMNTGSNGVKIYASLNNATDFISVNGGDYIVHQHDETDYSISNLSVERGDEIFFRVNCNGELGYDKTYFSPTVTYVSYDLPSDMAVSVSDNSLTVQVGAIRLLEAGINTNLGQDLKYVYSSSNESVARVTENGLIYAEGKGEAQITVTETGSGLSATCSVTVTESKASGNSAESGCSSVVSAYACVAAVAVIAVCACTLTILKRRKN